MKKLKDLIYDYNDIFVALLIIAVAGAIILWRVTNIMAYPDYLAGKEQTQTGDVDFSDVDLTPTNVDEFNENPEDITTQTPDEGESGEQTPAEQPTPGGDGVTQSEIKISIPTGSSGTGIAKILLEAGAISSTSDFIDKVNEMDAAGELRAGDFTIPAGSSLEDIINLIAHRR